MFVKLLKDPVRCVYFRINQRRPLKCWLKKVNKKISNEQNQKLLHKDILHLSMILRTIDYTSKVDKVCFLKLIILTMIHSREVITIRHVKIKDIYLRHKFHIDKSIKIKKLEFIKSVGIPENIKKSPIFEVRVHGLTSDQKEIDFGFRCIFFLTNYPHNHGKDYQCYTKPLIKRKAKNPSLKNKFKRIGNHKTNIAINMTYNEYMLYNKDEDNYKNEFSYNNLINPQYFKK